MFKKIIFFLILFSVFSCGGWSEFESAVTGAKKKTTDEYLIKKKDPLILPPDYKELPLPETKKRQENSNRIESILSDTENSKKQKKSPLESSIEEELRRGN